MYISAIVVAAGKGKRFKGRISKVILKLNSRPVVAYSLGVLDNHPMINEIIVVGNSGNIEDLRAIIRNNKIRKAAKVILGGRERKDSVAQGLKVISPKADFVLIHDAARPFITNGLVTLVINEARKSKAAIVGVPVKSTIKMVKSCNVEKTIDRNNLWEVQTPQVFEKNLIIKAYGKFGHQNVTDDAALVEKSGKKVKMVLGEHRNIKITSPEDLIIAKGLAKSWKPA
ncbi:MAG: 2-C-methyl-D-erythritol 4-phosphate cytidylyltransferase [Candidatus Omnitrophota bacterium]|jgi:2-C-methyl-D-erythritol 4-phosphate cytidylyltransferase